MFTARHVLLEAWRFVVPQLVDPNGLTIQTQSVTCNTGILETPYVSSFVEGEQNISYLSIERHYGHVNVQYTDAHVPRGYPRKLGCVCSAL